MHKLTSGALVVALTGTAVTVPATINPTAHYAEAQGLLGLGGQALQGLVEKGEAKVAELESQLWKADLALKGAQAVLEMKRWGVVLAIGEENKKAKQAEYDQQKLLVDSAELLVRTTKTSLDAARKTLAVTKKQLEDFNGKDPSAYEDAPEPDIKPVALPTNLREALESITAQQEAVAKRQALFDEADSAYTKRKKEVDSSWFSWLAPSNTKELEGLKNRRDARKAKLDLEQARLDNITRSIELFEAIEAETPAHDGHGADRYDATTPTNVDDASRQLEFANSTLEAATHRKANIEANLAALTGWQERNPFTGFWHNADKWTLERALRAADNEIADATKRIADKAAALEELKNAPAETEAVEPSAPEVEAPEVEAPVEPSAAAEPTEESAPRTPEPSAPEAAPEPSESEAPTAPESPATSSEESAPRTPETAEPTTDLSAATSTPATTSTSAPEESAPRTPEASESVEPADTSAEPEDQIDIDELTHNLDEAKKLEQDMLDLQKLLQQYINKPEAETTKPSETEVSPTTVTEVSAATSAPATTSVPTSEVSAARTTEAAKPTTQVSAATSTPATTSAPTSEVSAARTTEETAPTADSSAARTTPTEIASSEQSAARTTTSAKLSTVAVAPATSSEVSAAQTTEAAEPTTEVSAATSTPATTSVPTSEVSAARTTETTEPATEDFAARTTTSAKLSTVAVAPTTSSEVSAARTTEAAKPTTEVSAAASAPATTAAPTSSEVSAARTTERPEPTAESSAARTTPTEIPSSQQSAPQTTEAAKPTTEVSAATSTPATRPGSSAPRTTSQAPETTQQAKPTQQTEGAASGAEGSSASSWLWLILPLLLALGFGGAAYADLIPGVRLPRM